MQPEQLAQRIHFLRVASHDEAGKIVRDVHWIGGPRTCNGQKHNSKHAQRIGSHARHAIIRTWQIHTQYNLNAPSRTIAPGNLTMPSQSIEKSSQKMSAISTRFT